jgi:hypothetical protein
VIPTISNVGKIIIFDIHYFENVDKIEYFIFNFITICANRQYLPKLDVEMLNPILRLVSDVEGLIL